MYQLYAYGTKYTQCEDMYLIYPKDEEIEANSYNYFKTTDQKKLHLNILFFDVQKNEFVKTELVNKKSYPLLKNIQPNTLSLPLITNNH